VNWLVYILKCADGTLYTGITNDFARRLSAHRRGRGAKYTRGRGPFSLVYVERHGTKGFALRREAVIKSMSRAEKLGLVVA
jgi:predicted GIY-YIG superfamily endonuclease